MTVQFNTGGNTYLVGNVEVYVPTYFNATTFTADIPLAAYMQSEASGYPLDSGTPAAILYKIAPILVIGTVYDNTQIYQGIPNTFQIGSFNYGWKGASWTREFLNFQQQNIPECSGFYPAEGIFPGTSDTLYSYGVTNPAKYNPADMLYLYLPNAEIDTVTLYLHYSIEQFSNATTEYGYIWSSLSDTYGS
jgi:hypothetical protein